MKLSYEGGIIGIVCVVFSLWGSIFLANQFAIE